MKLRINIEAAAKGGDDDVDGELVMVTMMMLSTIYNDDGDDVDNSMWNWEADPSHRGLKTFLQS